MPDPEELKMDASERRWWEGVRARGALWYVATKGLFFLIAFPALGCLALEWSFTPQVLVEGWMVGLFWGAFFYMRKELRYRFTLEHEGLPLPDGFED